MPFDPAIGADTDPQAAQWLTRETDGSEFVPDLHHIAGDLVLLSDASLLAMIRVAAYAYELETMAARNIRRRQINDLIRGIADNNVALSIHLCHHLHVPPLPVGRFRSSFARQLFAKYRRNVLDGRLVANDWFLTVVVSPRFSPGRAIRRKLTLLGRRAPAIDADDGIVRQINSIMQSLMAYFGQDGAHRLGLRRAPEGHLCSEIAEARRMIITDRWQSVPLTNGTLGASIYTERVTCGTRGVRIDGLDGPRYAKTQSLRDYPGGETRTGQFSHLVKAQVEGDPPELFAFVMAQSFRFQGREEASTRLYLKLTRMTNAFDVQKRGMEKLDEVREEVVAGETVRGHHNFVLTVFGPDLDAVHRASGAAGSALNAGGVVPIQEDGGSFPAFWTMLPGNPDWLEGRSGSISSRNLTAMASLEGFPTGSVSGFWGPAIIRFATSGNTAYDFVTHVGDIGHALFIGRSGSGKTLLMTLLACALEQAMDDNDRVFFFDKDQAAEPTVRATGGAYLTLKAGAASGLAPLRGLVDTDSNRAFLEHWIAALMMADGRGALRDHTVKMLHRAVARQMRLPPDQRSLGAVRAFLGFGEDTDGGRLDRWCEGGADGWLFDGGADLVRVDANFIGFDLTQLFGHAACSHVAAYLLQRIRELIDGRRITVICDEVRFYLLNETFAEAIKDFSLTLRKKNGQLWIAAQEPGHIINSTIGTDLANQAQTMWVYPVRDANEDEYERLGFTAAMYRAITETMPTLPYRCVLLKRDTGSAILRTELADMQAEIDVLSGREETVRMIPAIRAEVGDDPEAFTAAFIRRCAAQRAKSKEKA
jgi:type IV secretion system protein VirB4